jgi:hypothetical protein
MFTRRLSNCTGSVRYFCAPKTTDPKPGEIFKLVATGDIERALSLSEEFATPLKMSPKEFLSKQCSERSYLIYRLSVDSRSDALSLAESGVVFPENISAHDLLTTETLWHEDIKEQYHRASNCIHLSRVSLDLGSPSPARDYQIIGKSIVWKLLFGRTACVLQTFLSRKLQQSKKPHDFAIANHRRAARLFDEELAPAGPIGPLEQPDSTTHDEVLFRDWSEQRIKSGKEHIRLIVHLASDVARHVLPRDEGRSLLGAAESILREELDDEKEIAYASGVFKFTLRAL